MPRIIFILLLAFVLPPFSGTAVGGANASDEAEFFSLEKSSLEEVLNIRTSVATRSTLPLREAPGLVTVITREEIQASGARDLLDVLKLVPEFEFGLDVQGNLGLGVRGNWANEGKVLLLWDAQPFNELLYSTLQFDRFPVDQIRKVEIIKGPGSVVYGGYAELAVIKVETLRPQELSGSEVYAAYGQGEKTRARSYAGYNFGRRLGATEVSAKAFWGDARRGDGAYRDLSGASYSVNSNSDLRPRSLNLYAARGGASTRLIVDDYSLRERDHFGSVLTTGPARLDFRSIFYEAKYGWDLSEGVRLEPRLNYAGARPWREDDEHFPYDKETARLTASLYSFYRPGSGGFDGMLGAEYYNDTIKIGAGTGAASAAGSGPRRKFDNVSLFGQASAEAGPASVAAGLRYETNSHYGSSLVPRLSATGVRGDFNFKAIYSQAFRAPSAENIRLNPGIDPERTISEEFEVGYKAMDSLFFSANVFNVRIKDPIVFTITGSSETYDNFDRSGTKGFGFSAKYKLGGTRADLGYLFQNTDCNTVGLYAVPGHGSYMLAFPRHKLTASASMPLADGVSLNPSAVYTSVRYGYSSAGPVKAYPAETLLDANMQFRNKLLRGLTINAGIKDIFNSGHYYIQPYNGGHAPLPGWGREFFVKAAYEF